MKKLFFTFAFSFLGCMVFAQTGALTINNNNAFCDVWVKMAAVDAGYSNGTRCDITGVTFMIPAGGGTFTFASPFDFDASAGGPGYASFTTPMTPLDLATTTTFQWTDVIFQWQCPIPPCQTNGGGSMADNFAILFGTNCAPPPIGTTWSGASCLSATSTWSNFGGTGVMDNMQIDFN
jgi:hypothetical protein